MIERIPNPDYNKPIAKPLPIKLTTKLQKDFAKQAASCITSAFPWLSTAEGLEFWRGVVNRLNQIAEDGILKDFNMTTLKTGIIRLEKLIAYIAKLPPQRFNFCVLAGEDWQGKPDLSCGTVGCALGWATTMPFFRRLGLHLSKSAGFVRIGVNDEYLTPQEIGVLLFGVSDYEAERLFLPREQVDYIEDNDDFLDNEATPKDWVRHARAIVKQLKKQL